MRFLYFLTAAACALTCFPPWIACSQPLGPGDIFPDFSHVNNLNTDECTYLGIGPEADFHLGSLRHDLVVLEFMNVFCDMCREDVELYNELYEISLGDSELGGTFAVLGIAVGNSFEEVMQFSDELMVRYPILLDTDREILELTGSVRGAPQTYILQRQDDRYTIRHFSRSATGKEKYLALLRTHLSAQSNQPAAPAQPFSYCVMINGVKYTEKQFAGSRVLLYFPHEQTYPHASDTRNTASQIAVLRRVLEQHPDIKIILVEPEGNGRKTLKGIELPPAITRATGDSSLFDQLAQPDHPTVYYIDAGGSAIFKGQALTMSALNSMIDGRYRAEPDMAEGDIISLITRTLAAQDQSVTDTVKTEIDGHTTYRTSTKDPARFYLSVLDSSPSLCDLCHDSHFVYSIDPKGTIVAFIPLWLPKRGNVSWSDEEVARYRKAFTGRSVFDTFPFNAANDAVSGATITSSIVYDGINRGKAIFKKQVTPPAGPQAEKPAGPSSPQ
jgi:peroxiredoxin